METPAKPMYTLVVGDFFIIFLLGVAAIYTVHLISSYSK